jgi:hypothetical protein
VTEEDAEKKYAEKEKSHRKKDILQKVLDVPGHPS